MPDHMANLDKLVPASFRGAKFAILEITDAVQVDARRGEDRYGNPKYEPAIVLRFKEFANRIYWVNTIGVNILLEEFGDEESQWVGKRVPLRVQENVRNPSQGGRQDMLWIPNKDEWDELFKEWDDALAAKKASTESRKGSAK
jgi:hypothetical protein